MDGVDIKRGSLQGKQDSGPTKRKPLPKSNGPQFTIPRLKKIKRDLLTDLSLDSHECQHDILAPVRKSFHFTVSNTCLEFNKVQAVYNADLSTRYLERRKEMKTNGYPDSLLAETFAFIPVENYSMAEKMCREGVRCGNQKFSGLGVSHMAVHVCRHADVVSPSRPKAGEKILLVVKVVKGKVKTVLCKSLGVQLEPTPNYDCHVAKPNVDQTAVLSQHMLLYSSQLYLYEYGDFEIVDYPRQLLPYAIVRYTFKDPPTVVPKPIVSAPNQGQLPNVTPPSSALQATTNPYAVQPVAQQDTGPSNEVWRGRLNIRLVAGGHIFIDVTMLSYYVPLTVSLISPIMIHSLYPEHNAQFTFFSGLSNIAHKEEVEWRAHYFKSFIMRPRPNNEEHFKALVKHISAKREMPTVKLPNDVFLFLMPNCLLASQLGLVRRDDDSPVLHCVLMSKFSTNQAQNKKLVDRKSLFKNYGGATGWESLFDDSDFSDDEEVTSNKLQLAKKLSALFREQRNVQNKFAAMSIVDADLNFSQCSCKKLSTVKDQCQRRRDADVARVLSACHSSSHSSQKGSVVSAAVSHQRPKQKMSKRTKSVPSFSPHGSSDSESDVENGKGASRRHKGRLSLLNTTKTIEEELSEEELTTEQMEDIIFLRKPAFTTVSSLRPKLTGHAQGQKNIPSIQKHSRSKDSHYQSVPDLHKSASEPLFNTKPKIIPTEPLEQVPFKTHPKPKIIKTEPKIIPVEPVISESKGAAEKVHVSNPELISKKEIESSAHNFVPKSILKNSVVSVIPLSKETVTHEVCVSETIQPPEVVEDFGDVDMRIPMQGPVTLHPIFLSARHLPFLEPSPPKSEQQQLSPNFSFGSWLAPGEIQEASLQQISFSNMGPSSVTSPLSPPAESPPSPADSPISPPTDSPASPPTSPAVMDIESPASPPQSLIQDRFRSSPIAIPTTRILHNVSPEVRFVHRLPSPRFPSTSESKERIDSANDMKNFLNSGFESDLDSSYEDER